MFGILRTLLLSITLALTTSAWCAHVPTTLPEQPISQLQLGDQVLAFNEWKQKDAGTNTATATSDTRLSYEKVVDIYTSYKQQTLVHLTLDNGQQLTATAGHPFKTTDGWRDAVLLKKGGKLLLKGGDGDADATAADLQLNLQLNTPVAQQNNAQAATELVANDNQATSAAQPGERAITIADIRLEVSTVPVYNLEVANAHTFFVGVDGVLVHNGFSKTPGKHGHHGYPQQFRDKFAEMGIDVDEHIFDLDPEKHRDLHRGKGCGVGGKWNKAWRDFFNDPRIKKTKATAETYLETLLKQAGL